jgi:hypothetical protein
MTFARDLVKNIPVKCQVSTEDIALRFFHYACRYPRTDYSQNVSGTITSSEALLQKTGRR